MSVVKIAPNEPAPVPFAGFLTPADCEIYPARDVASMVSALKKLHERRYDAAWIDRATRHARLRGQFAPERVAQQIFDLVTT